MNYDEPNRLDRRISVQLRQDFQDRVRKFTHRSFLRWRIKGILRYDLVEMPRIYPDISIGPEHQGNRGSFSSGLSAGRHDDSHLPREWFLSDAAYAAYLAGFEQGQRDRKDLAERQAVDTTIS